MLFLCVKLINNEDYLILQKDVFYEPVNTAISKFVLLQGMINSFRKSTFEASDFIGGAC